MTHEQVHNKFKLFTGPLATDGTIGSLGDQIAAFVGDHKVAAKSIGVEYLESSKKLVLSLGYREDGEHSPVKLSTIPIGPIGGLDGADVGRLEAAMGTACSTIDNIICHELYVTGDGDLLMVVMSEA